MKLRMEIIDQRNRECIESPIRTPTDYSKMWEKIMSLPITPAMTSGKIEAPIRPLRASPVDPFEQASKKVFEKVTAPEWGTKEWFYNTTMRDKEHQNQYVDSYGTVHRISAFT